MPVLTNGFEGLASGTTVTAANSGGNSGSPFDTVTTGTGATTAADSTQAMHGLVACKMATGVTAAAANVQWGASLGTQVQVWFRIYLFITGIPAIALRLAWLQASGTRCANLQINTSGNLQWLNTSGSAITGVTTTTTLPLSAWFRVEGFVLGSATVGQVETKLFTTADGTSAAETKTSAASQNTSTSPDTIIFGPNNTNANVGPFWVDDVGASSLGYMGPAPFLARTLVLSQAVNRSYTY